MVISCINSPLLCIISPLTSDDEMAAIGEIIPYFSFGLVADIQYADKVCVLWVPWPFYCAGSMNQLFCVRLCR